ncbi:MAG: hypothetical protein IJU81_02205 [Bacteroidales bacterium]|nr:hypothetical protein [Bacteroidales bacterium]
MVVKRKKIKNKRITFMLSAGDYEALQRYAKANGCGVTVTARRAVKCLIETIKKDAQFAVSKNQLSIFDSIQTDIFNGSSKA